MKLFIWLLIVLGSYSFSLVGYSQCSSCSTVIGTNTAFTVPANNYTICITSSSPLIYSSTINFNNNTGVTLCIGSNVTVSGSLINISSNPTGVTINNYGYLLSSISLNNNNTLNNYGTLLPSSFTFNNNATFFNASTGYASISGFSMSGGGSVINYGNLYVNGDFASSASSSAIIQLCGTANINGNMNLVNPIVTICGAVALSGSANFQNNIVGTTAAGTGCTPSFCPSGSFTFTSNYTITGLTTCKVATFGANTITGSNTIAVPVSSPTNLSASTISSGISLSFTPATGSGVGGYVIVRNVGSLASAPSSPYNFVVGNTVGTSIIVALGNNSTTSNFIDNQPLVCGTTYYYSVYSLSVFSSTACNTAFLNALSPATANITVNVPTTITKQPISSSTCAGTSVALTVSATGINLTYQWLKGGATISGNASSLSFTSISTTATGVYTVSVSGLCGTVLSSLANLTVNPITTIVTQPQSQSTCPLLSVTLDVSATGTNLTYLWSNGNTSSSQSVLSIVNATNIYTVTVSGKCGNSVSVPATVVWGIPLTASVSIASTATSICQGTQLTFTATGVNGGTSPTYTWKLNGNATTITGTTLNYTPVNNDLIECVMQAGGLGSLCIVGSPATSNALTITVTSTASSSISLTSSTTVGCAGSNISFTTTGSNWGSSPSYAWYVSGAKQTVSGATFNYTPTNGDIVRSSVTIGGTGISCVVGTQMTSSGISLTVIPTVAPSISLASSSNGVCAGGMVTLTAIPVNGGSSPNYQWKLNGVNIGSGTNTYSTNSLLSTDNVSVILVPNNTCQTLSNTTSTSVNIVITATGTWLGNSTDWHTSSNWCGGVPTSTTTALIGSTINNPIISLGNATVGSVTISSSGSLSISNNMILSVYGSWQNNGQFSANSSTIIFAGTAQTISGTSSSAFNNLTITNSISGVFLSVPVSVTGIMQLGNSAKYSSGNYTTVLVSNASSTAKLIAVPSSATFTGKITMQRYVPAKPTLRLFSSAVNGSLLSDWKSSIPISGSGGTSNGFDASPANINTVWYFDETINAPTTYRFVGVSNINTSLAAGRGYRVYVRGDRSTCCAPNLSSVTATSAIMSVTNSPNIGAISLPVTYTNYNALFRDGYNLVGNPYPCEINWDASGWVKTNIDDAIYMWDPNLGTNGQYFSYVAGVSTPARTNPGIIGSSQGFFVKANAASPSLIAAESVKTVVGYTPNFRTEPVSIDNLVRITLRDSANGFDETVIRFIEESSVSFEGKFDAYKIFNSTINIWSTPSSGLDLSINSLPIGVENTSIPLSISSNKKGKHSLQIGNLESFTNLPDVYLEDHYLNNRMKVAEGDRYDFEVTNDPNSIGSERFELSFLRSQLTLGLESIANEGQTIKVYPNPNNGSTLTLDLYNFPEGTCDVAIMDVSGNNVIVYKVDLIGNKLFSSQIPGFDSIPNGVYFLQVILNKSTQTVKIAVIK